MATTSQTKVCLAVPSGDLMNPRFVGSLINLIDYTKTARPDIDLRYHNQVGSRITENRNLLVQGARTQGSTHILFLDADMTVPPNALISLLDRDLDIVCATACKRKEGESAPIGIPMYREDLVTDSNALVEMNVVGMPLMLVRLAVFDKLPKPYFAEPIIEGELVAEDVYFCKIAREAGYRIWCDMNLSLRLGHIGIKEFRIQPFEAPALALPPIDLPSRKLA